MPVRPKPKPQIHHSNVGTRHMPVEKKFVWVTPEHYKHLQRWIYPVTLHFAILNTKSHTRSAVSKSREALSHHTKHHTQYHTQCDSCLTETQSVISLLLGDKVFSLTLSISISLRIVRSVCLIWVPSPSRIRPTLPDGIHLLHAS
jgi:hypothetical protein